MGKAEYVLVAAKGIVKEVYQFDEWLPAQKLSRETIPYDSNLEKDRIGFNGRIAEDIIRKNI